MDSGVFSAEDINDELLHSIDRFFKATIRNAMSDYCQKKYTEQAKKNRTLSFEECENLLCLTTMNMPMWILLYST